jgi:hypothetical protein
MIDAEAPSVDGRERPGGFGTLRGQTGLEVSQSVLEIIAAAVNANPTWFWDGPDA